MCRFQVDTLAMMRRLRQNKRATVLVVAFAMIAATDVGYVKAIEIPTDTAVLGWLDKVTGRVNTLEAWVGDTIRIGTLSINVQTCMTRPPEETPEKGAFIKIWESRPGESSNEVFSGWMFASSPALSAMDHPVYDVWVLGCKDRRRSIIE